MSTRLAAAACAALVFATVGSSLAARAAGAEPLTVAVLAFETKGKSVADLGEKIADLLTAFLSAQDGGLQLVERDKIKKVLEELELGASGLVAPDQAARIGGLVGAKVLITGRAFVVGGKLYVTGKAISVETSRVGAQLVKGGLDEDLDVVVQPLAEKMAAWLGKHADKMVARIQTPADQVAALRKAIQGKRLPTVAALVLEAHIGQATIDPAAETELVYLMRRLGIPVIAGRQLHVSDWAKEYLRDASLPLPSAASRSDVLIVGEGFSEFAGRKGNLISVKARLEVKAVDTATGRILAVARRTVTQVDLAEQVAGKSALQKAAGQAAVELLPKVIDQWIALHKGKAPKAAATQKK